MTPPNALRLESSTAVRLFAAPLPSRIEPAEAVRLIPPAVAVIELIVISPVVLPIVTLPPPATMLFSVTSSASVIEIPPAVAVALSVCTAVSQWIWRAADIGRSCQIGGVGCDVVGSAIAVRNRSSTCNCYLFGDVTLPN